MEPQHYGIYFLSFFMNYFLLNYYFLCWSFLIVSVFPLQIILCIILKKKQQIPSLCLSQGCQPLAASNIENWWGVGDRWRHNAGHMTSFLEKKTCRKDVVLIVTFDLIGLLPTNHIIAYITMVYQSLWANVQYKQKNSSNKAKYLKFHCQRVESTKNGNFGDYPGDFRL